MPTIGSKEAVFGLANVLDGEYVVVPEPAYPVYDRGARVRGQADARAAAARGERLAAGARRRRLGSRGDPVAELPEQPDRRDGAAGVLRGGGRAGAPRTGSCSPPTRRTRSCTSARRSGVRAAGPRPLERRRVQHAVEALVDAGLPLRVRRGRSRDHRGAEEVPAERRRRAAGVLPARGGRGLERRRARRRGARALPRQARRDPARAGGDGAAQRRRRRDVLPVAGGARRRSPRSGSRRA